MKRKPLLWQLFPSYLLITVVSLVAVTWYAGHAWRKFYLDETAADLKARARLVEHQLPGGALEAAGPGINEICKRLGRLTATRLTVIGPSGKVLGDSDEDPARMENHADRPEFQEAMRGRVGIRDRYSHTLKKSMLYVAIPLQENGRVRGVVRASLPVHALDRALRGVYLQVILGGLVIACLAAVVSLMVARRLNRPLEEMKRGAARFARGDLGRQVPVPDTEELASLAEALNTMAAQLDDRIDAILRQRQEEEAVLASMVEGVLAVDGAGRLISLNRAGGRMLGVDPATVEGCSIPEVVRNPDLQWFVTRAQAAAQPIEGEIVLHEAPERVLQVHGTTLRDPRGKTLGILIVLHDVTELRKLEKARRDFVANVSHELKTPITSIKGFVETLLNGALADPEHAREFLGIIGRQAERLNAIIDDLLSLSRIEQDAEKGRIELSGGRIKTVLDAAVQVCAGRALEKDIKLSLTCPDDLRGRLNAPLLEQAVVNLIDNAVKYSPPGSAVTVEAGPENGKVVIRVRDQGVGIAKEHQPRIFERFYRVDVSRSRKAGGTGLGLAIVKHIAQAHGGTVTVESTLGRGSTFSLHLLKD